MHTNPPKLCNAVDALLGLKIFVGSADVICHAQIAIVHMRRSLLHDITIHLYLKRKQRGHDRHHIKVNLSLIN